jgi:hypothetical protein
MRNIKSSLCLAAGFAILPCNVARADDHVVLERIRSYMGTTAPKVATEIWLSDTAVFVEKRDVVTIYRFDLGKIWKIPATRSEYSEEPLTPPDVQETHIKQDSSVHSTGFEYEPEYDWHVTRTDREDTVNGYACRHFLARGEADYAQRSIDMLVANDVPINVIRFYTLYLEYSIDSGWRSLYRTDRQLQECFLMKAAEAVELPIAPTMTFEMTVTKVEATNPPNGIYDLPRGLKKAATGDERNR